MLTLIETLQARRSENLASLLEESGHRFASRPALSVGGEVALSYGAFAERAARLGAGLRAEPGLRPGDRVAVILRNELELMPLLFGIWRAGLVAVPVGGDLPAEAIARIVRHAGARLAITSPALRASLEGPLAARAADLRLVDTGSEAYRAWGEAEPGPTARLEEGARSAAWILYTSGTTGAPKGVTLSHQGLRAAVRRYLEEVEEVRPEESLLQVTPMSRGAGVLGLVHVAAGANQVLPASGGLDPREVGQLLARWPQSRICLAPVLLRALAPALAARPALARNLKRVVYGSAPIPQGELRRAEALFGGKLIQLYGLSEIPGGIACLSPAGHAEVAAQDPALAARGYDLGSARPSVSIALWGADGEPLPKDGAAIGEIVCRGEAMMTGYWRDPVRTSVALEGGWLRTGDIGRVDAQGRVRLLGRAADAIETAVGVRYPVEFEERLLSHEAVEECAVIGRPRQGGAEGGAEVLAFLVCRPGEAPTRRELSAAFEGGGDRPCPAPDRVFFVSELPRNASGKVDRAALRDHVPALEARWTEWQRYESGPWAPVRARIARTLEDARAIRAIVRDSWKLPEGERYFYDLYERPEEVHERLLAPVAEAEALEELSSLCVLLEAEGEVFGTFSLVFDHERREVEIGRGGIRATLQGRRLASQSIPVLRRLSEMAPGYHLVVDATLVQPGAGLVALGIGAPALGIYPSSFVFQPRCAEGWAPVLERRHGEAIAEALVHRSPRTGLGRFATAFHRRLPGDATAWAPVLTERQRPLFDHSRRALGLEPGLAPQPSCPPSSAKERVYDGKLTATRTITAPAPDLDPDACRREAAEAGMETVILRVPCDEAHLGLARRLESSGAWLAGLDPDAEGRWLAGYVLFVGEAHEEQVRRSLRCLAAGRQPAHYASLLRLLLEVNEGARVEERRAA